MLKGLLLKPSGVLVFEGCVDVSDLKSDYYMNSSNRLSYMILKESDYDETKGIYLEHLSKALHIGQTNYSIDDGSYTINLKIKAETGNYKLLVYAPVIGTEVYDLISRRFVSFAVVWQICRRDRIN